jgi:integrase/recombinase XerD
MSRTPARQKARQLTKYLHSEQPDYVYLKEVFRHLREELGIKVPQSGQKKLPVVPTEAEIQRYYEVVWQARNVQDMLIIKTLLYTGVRVGELIRIRLEDIDLDRCQIRINQGKGSKDRVVPFPSKFQETLAIHIDRMQTKGATSLFESRLKKPYSDRGIRKILSRYAEAARLSHPISPHKLRHFLLTWLKKQGIDDALLQPYSGHASRQSLEVYSRLAISEAQEAYDQVIDDFPV